MTSDVCSGGSGAVGETGKAHAAAAAASDNAAAVKIGLIISEFPLLEGHRSIDADITIGGEGGVMTDAPDPTRCAEFRRG